VKTTAEPDRPQMTIWHMRIACWMPKTKNTRSEYVILIALPRQKWLNERASLLRYSTLPVYSVLKKDVAFHQHGNMKHHFTVQDKTLLWCLFNDTASNSECLALSGSMIDE
jgi:hypothetical protein